MKDYQASSNYDDDTHLWVMYRYGEVLLNYAEALNEVALSGGTTVSYTHLFRVFR